MEFDSNSNYNALQAHVSKRFSSNFTFNLAYTWSKVLDVADTPTSAVNPDIDFNSRATLRPGGIRSPPRT